MINPREFAVGYTNFKIRSQTCHSIESDAIRSFNTISNFYTNKSLTKYKSHYFPRHSYMNMNMKQNRALVTVDSMKNFNNNYIDKEKGNFDRSKHYNHNE